MRFLHWFDEHREEFDALLFDIDGTLATGPRQLPGAAETLQYLRTHQIPYALLTNDGNNSRMEKSALIARSGLHIPAEEIISCADGLQEIARERNLTGVKVFALADLGTPSYVELAGMVSCTDLAEIDDCAAVVVGEGVYDWYRYIHGVMNFFRRHPDRLMLIPNPDSYWPGLPGGGVGIGAGGVARFILTILKEMGVEPEAIFIGKPFSGIYQHAQNVIAERFGITALRNERWIMVGDSLASDIRGANWLGMTSAVLLTGITSLEQAQNALPPLRPHHIFDSL